MSSAQAKSAVVSVSTSGVLVTKMPFRVAAATSMLSNPTATLEVLRTPWRLSITAAVRRVAKERHLTISRALVTLAERGVRAEQEAKENLNSAYREFLKEQEPSKKDEAGKKLIQAIFGKDAIAEDQIL